MSPVFAVKAVCQGICLDAVCQGVKVLSPDIFAVERARAIPRARSAAENKILGYSTRNHVFERLEPHFQISTTRSASKEATESAAASAH